MTLGAASLTNPTAFSYTVALGLIGGSSSIDRSMAPLAKSLSLRVMVDSTPCGILREFGITIKILRHISYKTI
jgi:hypothetical protein